MVVFCILLFSTVPSNVLVSDLDNKKNESALCQKDTSVLYLYCFRNLTMKAVRSVAVCAIFMSIWIGSTSEAVEHGPKGRSVRDFVKSKYDMQSMVNNFRHHYQIIKLLMDQIYLKPKVTLQYLSLNTSIPVSI